MTKPRIAIFATGGTIASRADNSLELNNYGQVAGFASLEIQALINAVPEIQQFADITGEQVVNIGSARMALADWLTIARRINTLAVDPKIDGFVITHGTDTMEETAYFLNLVVKTHKPVVMVGAMRPATGMSADGPLNLVNAVALAASPEAAGKGVLAVMNDQISSAFGIEKTNTTNVATFRCPDTGFLGYMQDTKPYFYSAPLKKHTLETEFSLEDFADFPRVDVNFTTLGCDGLLVDAMVEHGVKGIVNAGVGHANMSNALRESLVRAIEKGIPVVLTSRVPTGIVTPVGKFEKFGFIAGYMHTPQKARVLLMLALTRTQNFAEIQRIFSTY